MTSCISRDTLTRRPSSSGRTSSEETPRPFSRGKNRVRKLFRARSTLNLVEAYVNASQTALPSVHFDELPVATIKNDITMDEFQKLAGVAPSRPTSPLPASPLPPPTIQLPPTPPSSPPSRKSEAPVLVPDSVESPTPREMPILPPLPPLPALPPISSHPSHQTATALRYSPSSSSSTSSTDYPSPQRGNFFLPVVTDAPVTDVPKQVRKVFDTSMRMLSRATQLSFVYLVQLSRAPDRTMSTIRLLASHGLPSPTPSFDPALHLKALRAPEGGLLYQRPTRAGDQTGDKRRNDVDFAAGILVPVIEVRGTGFVLCGFTHDEERPFEGDDLFMFECFAQQLEGHCLRVGRM